MSLVQMDPQAEIFCHLNEAFDKLVVDTLMDVDTARRRANPICPHRQYIKTLSGTPSEDYTYLPLVVQAPGMAPFNSLLKIGVFENNPWVFPSTF